MPVAIPVLMYHHINPHCGDTVTVTPEIFEAQMHFLAVSGYRTLSLPELLDHVSEVRSLSEKAVVITFDDGWLDNYRFAVPVLARLCFKAAFFVITARVDAASVTGCTEVAGFPCHDEAKRLIVNGHAEQVVLDWGTINGLACSGLFEFHSHTVSHCRSADLERKVLVTELLESKLRLEQKLGRPSPYLCWPYGSFTRETVALAIKAGYEALFTTIEGFTTAGADRFMLKRFEVQNDLAWFKELLQASHP